MKIAMRVDASARMGTGHLRRSLSLAQALRDLGAQVRFVTRNFGLESAKLIAALGFTDTVMLSSPSATFESDPAIPHGAWAGVSQAQDIEETVSELSEFAPDWVVVDSYAFDRRWHDGVRSGLGCKIAQIDDVPDRKISPNLLIDHNHAPDHRSKYSISLMRDATVLGGPRFALLDPAFANAEQYEFHEDVRSVGVFMGGADAGNHSFTVLDALDEIGFSGAVEVVTTSANPNLEQLRKRVASRANASLSIDLPNLAAFFSHHDLHIGAGGGATWERCCIGVPTLMVVVAENQREVAPQLASEGIVALAAGPSSDTFTAELAGLLENHDKRRELAMRSRTLVDGHGAMRAALAMMADTLTVRSASLSDAKMMFDWRNDEMTRSVSLDSAALKWDDHVAWLDHVLADPKRKPYIGLVGERPVGVIRFDFSGPDHAEVSLYLDPALHGIGLGPRLLLAGESAAEVATVDATVLESNLPSQRMFERCGYLKQSPGKWVKHRA